MTGGYAPCSATVRERAKLHICERPFGHEGQHADLDHQWSDNGGNDRTVYVEQR